MNREGVGDPEVRAAGRSKPDREWYPDNFDWYLKWVASVIVLCSLAMRAAGPEYRMLDIYFGWVGIALWIWVSVIWRDRALIMLNVVSWFMLTVAILKEWQSETPGRGKRNIPGTLIVCSVSSIRIYSTWIASMDLEDERDGYDTCKRDRKTKK